MNKQQYIKKSGWSKKTISTMNGYVSSTYLERSADKLIAIDENDAYETQLKEDKEKLLFLISEFSDKEIRELVDILSNKDFFGRR